MEEAGMMKSKKRLGDPEFFHGKKAAVLLKVKAADGDQGGDPKAPSSTADAAAAAADEEVEEFYAILRRIHTAVKYFGKDKRRRKAAAATNEDCKNKAWNPSFLQADFEDPATNGVVDVNTGSSPIPYPDHSLH